MLLNPISTEREVAMKILAIALLAASVIISVFSLLPNWKSKKSSSAQVHTPNCSPRSM
jgi:hypothetical protein